MKYFANLSAGRTVLWCYLIWHLFFVTRYFDASRNLWLTSPGISGIIGLALIIRAWDANTRPAQFQKWGSRANAGKERRFPNRRPCPRAQRQTAAWGDGRSARWVDRRS